MSDVSDTLKARNSTHGDYHEQAELAAALRHTMQSGKYWRKLTNQEEDALLMIAVKISRILTGNPHFEDSWHDIAGYATLVERDLQTHRKDGTDGTDTGLLGPIVPSPNAGPWRVEYPTTK